jgi:hypothetical protein
VRGIQGNAFSVCVCVCVRNASEFEVTGCCTTGTERLQIFFLNMICSRESQNCMHHRCSNFPGQSQLQTVVEELFQTNDFDVEDSIVYKQWVHDHTKLYL